MEASAPQLVCLKALLHTFAESTGLRINYSKSQMISINLPDSKAETLARTFGWQLSTVPFTYLGLPMGTTKPKIEDLSPIMGIIERRLSACSSLLSPSGRIEMENSVITPTTTYAMCTTKSKKGAIGNIDRIRKQCIWRGNNTDKKGGNLAAWPLVIKPKNKGGLGVLNLRLQNDALLLKHLHKFYSRQDIPWVNLIWLTYYTDKVPHASR
jgi:hypothetical protein